VKFKRISRSKEFQKLMSLAREEVVMKAYQKEAKGRRELQRKWDEENRSWWERKRKADYMVGRRSERFIRITHLNLEDYDTNSQEEENYETNEERSELIPKQNYNINRRRFRNYYGKRKKKRIEPLDKRKSKIFRKEEMFNIRTRNKGWRFKDALKRKRFKEKTNKKILIIYQKNQKYKEEGEKTIQLNPMMDPKKVINEVMEKIKELK
jgi:hypothetical protein